MEATQSFPYSRQSDQILSCPVDDGEGGPGGGREDSMYLYPMPGSKTSGRLLQSPVIL